MCCTKIDICESKINTKPRTASDAQLNWAIISQMQKWVCCLQKLEVVTGMQTTVFGNIITPTNLFEIPLTIPLVDRELIEVEWNGQDIYHISEIPSSPVPEISWSISDNNILLTMSIGDPSAPCYIAVKVLTKKKLSDAVVCPELTVTNPCCEPCNC